MPRKKFIADPVSPYNISARCHNKEWFKIPMDEVWEIFSNYLFFMHHAHRVKIHAFVLMNNHFHLIVSTPEANLDKAMNYFLRETSRIISEKAGRINQVYGGPYYWSILRDEHSYLNAYKYLYRNPLEAGVCATVESYKYSTLQTLLGQTHSVIPLEPDEHLFSDTAANLDWLNKPYPSIEIREDVRRALKHSEFKLAKDCKSHIMDMRPL